MYKVIIFGLVDNIIYKYELHKPPYEDGVPVLASPYEAITQIENFLNDMNSKGYDLVSILINAQDALTVYIFRKVS